MPGTPGRLLETDSPSTGGGGGTPPGAPVDSVQFNNAGAFGGLANVLSDGGGRIEHLSYEMFRHIADPSAAGTDKLRFYGRRLSGRMFPHWQGAVDDSHTVPVSPPWILRHLRLGHMPGSAAVSTVGINNTSVGTITTPTLTNVSFQTQLHRARFASAAAAGSGAGSRGQIAYVWRGDVAGFGGFWYACIFDQSTNINGARAFVGLSAQLTQMVTDPDTINNTIGMGYRVADVPGNWFFIRRDAAAATVTDLGADAPRDATTVFLLLMYCPPNGSDITVRIVNLTTGVVVLDDVVMSTNIPQNTAFLSNHLNIHNGAVASVVQIETSGLMLESPW